MEYVYADEAIDMGATLDDELLESLTLLYGIDMSEYVDWPLGDFATTEELLTQTFTE